jgi:hypothetical protein
MGDTEEVVELNTVEIVDFAAVLVQFEIREHFADTEALFINCFLYFGLIIFNLLILACL